MIPDRLHALRFPNMTCCGREGRALDWPRGKVILQGDNTLRIGSPTTCLRCIAYIAKHGAPFGWDMVDAHQASVIKRRPRRRRRQKRPDEDLTDEELQSKYRIPGIMHWRS